MYHNTHFNNKNYKYTTFLILVLSLVGVIIKVFRKKFIRNLTMHTTVTLDVVLTSIFVCCYMFLFSSYGNIIQELKTMPLYNWFVNILISLLLACGIILGRFLLLRNKISYLEGMHISFDLLLSVLLGNILLNETINKTKMIGTIFILTGMIFINSDTLKLHFDKFLN
jgi:uncharacterized membrane protein